MTCPHPDWALVATYDGHRRVERCDECNTITHTDLATRVINGPCGCATELETDILGRYIVLIRCEQHARKVCERCGAIIYGTPIHDPGEVWWTNVGQRAPMRTWCSDTCWQASAEQQSAGA